MLGSLVLNVTNLIGQAEAFSLYLLLSRSALHGSCASSPFFLASIVRDHGRVHAVIRKSAGLRLSLLRPHRHSRLLERSVSTRAGGVFRPSGSGPPGGEQRSAQPTHRGLPGLGGSLRPQPSPPY